MPVPGGTSTLIEEPRVSPLESPSMFKSLSNYSNCFKLNQTAAVNLSREARKAFQSPFQDLTPTRKTKAFKRPLKCLSKARLLKAFERPLTAF